MASLTVRARSLFCYRLFVRPRFGLRQLLLWRIQHIEKVISLIFFCTPRYWIKATDKYLSLYFEVASQILPDTLESLVIIRKTCLDYLIWIHCTGLRHTYSVNYKLYWLPSVTVVYESFGFRCDILCSIHGEQLTLWRVASNGLTISPFATNFAELETVNWQFVQRIYKWL